MTTFLRSAIWQNNFSKNNFYRLLTLLCFQLTLFYFLFFSPFSLIGSPQKKGRESYFPHQAFEWEEPKAYQFEVPRKSLERIPIPKHLPAPINQKLKNHIKADKTDKIDKSDAYEEEGFNQIHDRWKLVKEKPQSDHTDWKYSGWVDLKWNFFYQPERREETSTNNPSEELLIKAEKDWGKKYRALLSVYHRYQDFNFNKNGFSENIVDLHENYLDIFYNKNDLRIGKQLIIWGKADEINPTDNANFQDFYQFVLPSRNRRKIPIWALRNRFYFGNVIIDSFISPVFEKPRLPDGASPWLPLQLKAAEEIRKNPFIPLLEKEREKIIENVSGGLRVSHRTDTVDYSFSAWSGFSGIPFFNLLPSKPTPFGPIPEGAELIFPRMSVLGMDISASQGGYGIRGEAGLSLNAPYQGKSDPNQDQADSVFYKNTFSYIVGVDYTFKNEGYVNLQWGQNILLQPRDTVITDSLENLYTLELKQKLYNRWEGSTRITHNITNGDKWVHYQLKKDLDRGRSLFLTNDTFSGDESKGAIGQFASNDLVTLRFELIY